MSEQGERPLSNENARKAAKAMRTAADETGVDFMTSPLSDIVKALELATEYESGFRPLRGGADA